MSYSILNISTNVNIDTSIQKQANHTLALIDSVHKVQGPLLNILNQSMVPDGKYTHYNKSTVIDANTLQPTAFSLTLAHEIGHYFDYNAFSNLDFNTLTYHNSSLTYEPFLGSSIQPVLRQIILNLVNTPSCIRIQNMISFGLPAKNALGVIGLHPISTKTRNELLDLLEPKELWARSYAQYIASKTQDQNMLQCIHMVQATPKQPIPFYWETNEFLSIIPQIDALLKKIAWM